MKLTKVNGISHYKNIECGELINNKRDLTEKIVIERFEKQIQSRIFNEFIRMNGNMKINNEKIEAFALYNFIEELYTGKNNEKWEENLKEIDFEKLEKDECLKIQYKLKSDQSLFQYQDFDRGELVKSKTFRELFERFKNELTEKKYFLDIRKLESYKEIKSIFEEYKKRKIEKIICSLKNNKYQITFKENQIIGCSKNEKYFIDLTKKILVDDGKKTIEDELRKISTGIESFLKNIENIFKEKKDTNYVKFRVLQELRIYLKECANDCQGKKIFNEELKKYIESNLSNIKKNRKKDNATDADNDNDLYYSFLKKIFCIKIKDEMDIEKFISIIKNNFKNRLTSHIIDYGKVIYYRKNNILKDKIESKDLEFIKSSETLTRKLTTLLSFATFSFYNIFDIRSNDYLEDFIYKKNIPLEFKNKVNIQKLNYFFDKELNKNNQILFVETILKSISEIRNSVVHFKTEKSAVDNNREEIAKKYFIKAQESISKKIAEKFLSNNIEHYYNEQCIKTYFKIYKYKLLKEKIPFAPSFKRIINKGGNLYKSGDIKRYKYFIDNQNNGEKFGEFLNAKNFLLSQLYYNNFLSFFLSNPEKFAEAQKIAKKRKEETNKVSGEKLKKAGKSYENIISFDKRSIAEYVALIHKQEMDRLDIENRFDVKSQKSTAHFLKEYLEDIFLEGFLNWLKNNQLDFLAEKSGEDLNKIKKDDILKLINKGEIEELKYNSSILKWYLVLSLVDNKRLMEFSNEIVKYRQFLKERGKKTEFLSLSLDDYLKICELILLTKERLGYDKNIDNLNDNEILFKQLYSSPEEYDDFIEMFIEKDILNNDKSNDMKLYYQGNNTPILHSTLEDTRKFSTYTFLNKLNVKLTEKENEECNELKNEILNIQLEKKNYHDDWCKNKNKKNEQEKQKFFKNCNRIRRYNYLKNKQGFQNIYNMHQIISDIQARYIAFLNKFERDFKFILEGVRFLTGNLKLKDELTGFLSDELDSFFSIGNYINKIAENNSDFHENFIKQLYGDLVFCNDEAVAGIRNYIAHFHHFTMHKEKSNEPKTEYLIKSSYYSVVDQMNSLIELFNYDEKTKNHINKAVKTILEKYNIVLKFELVDDSKSLNKYKIKNIYSKKGRLLGKQAEFKILEDDFINEIRVMLEYSSKSKE